MRDGLHLRPLKAGTSTTYTQDYAAPLPVALQAKTGSASTQYLYSLGTRPVAEYEAAAWEYLLADPLGSVRQIANTSADVTLLKSYEPYGGVLNSTGSAISIFAYAGEQQDNTGLVYLRARYMSPRLGQFVSQDPLHLASPYRYASSNPINRIDPSGYIDWPTCVTQGDYGTCTIWDGDTLYKIAREINAAGVPVDVPQIVADIIALNPQIQGNPNYLRIGDSLTLRASWINAVNQSKGARPPVYLPPPQVKPPRPSPVPVEECDIYERADLTQWLVDEMNTDRKTAIANVIAANLWDKTNPVSFGVAHAMFADVVKTHGLWDFKWAINSIIGPSIRLADDWYRSDVPGNMFFSYIGVAIGFGKEVLHCGADFAHDRQICSGSDPREDYEAVEAGFDIWRLSGGGDVNEGTVKAALAAHPGVARSVPMLPKDDSLMFTWPYAVGTFDDGVAGTFFQHR